MLKKFKEFAFKGNVIDMSVGVIIGGAFGKIVSSLVTDIIMPFIGVISGGIDFQGLSVTVGEAVITYGNFIQAVIDFFIIAVSIFAMVTAIQKAASLRGKKEEEEAAAEIAAPTTEELLAEIRDILKDGSHPALKSADSLEEKE